MKPMATLYDLIEEAKVRALWWGICIFGITYFLSHTSKSMWTNLPISILILCALRYISYEVELCWKVRPVAKQSYLSHLQKKQLSLDDPCLKTLSPMSTWKKKVNSPLVETAVKDFINKLLHDFVVDLWYSSITPDKEAPELIKALILDVIGEVSLRIRDINLVDLLTRDIVELIGNHLELFRKNQSIIGVQVMRTLSSEERDEKLKHHMLASKELHPALISSECEYKTLQRIVGGILAVVLNQREVQSPLVLCFARELLTCLVMEPVMNLASPGYINELIELIYLNSTVDTNKDNNVNMEASAATVSTSSGGPSDNNKLALKRYEASNPHSDINVASAEGKKPSSTDMDAFQEDPDHSLPPKPADWARVLDAATQRRTQVLAPENLENMWTKGRNYRKKTATLAKAVSAESTATVTSKVLDNSVDGGVTKELSTKVDTDAASDREKLLLLQESIQDAKTTDSVTRLTLVSKSLNTGQLVGANSSGLDGGKKPHRDTGYQLKRSSSTSDLKSQNYGSKTLGPRSKEAVFAAEYKNQDLKASAESIYFEERPLDLPKLRCRVVGAYFEKAGGNSFAVYSIAVTDTENKTWFVKRRYRNFERLHRQLKDIPNYTLHLPPKRFLSSSIDDYFVHQRCILLDKYLKDLLSIANIAEQHEVWDFLSSSSKNYSFGKSTSVMKTLAVNVDDAMDDIVRQFKGVSDGLLRKVAGNPSSFPNTVSPSTSEKALSLTWTEDENNKHNLENSNVGVSHSLSDDEIHEDEGSVSNSGWHSDNELNSKGLPPRVLKHNDHARSVGSQDNEFLGKLERVSLDHSYISKTPETSDRLGEPDAVPPEWSPPNVSVPILNLVDNVFQLKKRGWLRRQVFWISKQIIQLMMDDAIDDWLLRQIHWLRRDDIVAQGISWLQDVLWPNGVFFIKLESNQQKADDGIERNQNAGSSSGRTRKGSKPVSFEEQLEATRRASELKKLLLGGAPTTLVSLIGNKQYRRCTRDIYYFLQSSVCIKQLAYGILELVVISIFPELHDLILDVHQNA